MEIKQNQNLAWWFVNMDVKIYGSTGIIMKYRALNEGDIKEHSKHRQNDNVTLEIIRAGCEEFKERQRNIPGQASSYRVASPC